MKKHIKIIVFVLSLLIVYFTYSIFLNQNSKIIYIPLGDSIAEGMNSYHKVEYGYPDYISDYFKEKDKLSFYTKKYAISGYTIEDVTNDIEKNKEIEIDGKKYYLKERLRESDLVTLTIGANNFMNGMSLSDIPVKLLNPVELKKEADEISNKVKELIELIKKYAKGKIVVTGYYNPLPRALEYKNEIDELIKYYNNLIEEICNELDVTYVDIFNIFDNRDDLLPNPLDIHPTTKGYDLISKEIIKNIEELTN